MKIVNKRKYEGINVTDIRDGEIFSQDGQFYLKLAENYEGFNLMRKERMIEDLAENLLTRNEQEGIAAVVAGYTSAYNAVDLETNELTYASGVALLVNAELSIDGFK